MNRLFFTIYGIILPIDELIFFKMVKTTKQNYLLEVFTEVCWTFMQFVCNKLKIDAVTGNGVPLNPLILSIAGGSFEACPPKRAKAADLGHFGRWPCKKRHVNCGRGNGKPKHTPVDNRYVMVCHYLWSIQWIIVDYYNLIGGLEHGFYMLLWLSIYWEKSSQLTNSYFSRGVETTNQYGIWMNLVRSDSSRRRHGRLAETLPWNIAQTFRFWRAPGRILGGKN